MVGRPLRIGRGVPPDRPVGASFDRGRHFVTRANDHDPCWRQRRESIGPSNFEGFVARYGKLTSERGHQSMRLLGDMLRARADEIPAHFLGVYGARRVFTLAPSEFSGV